MISTVCLRTFRNFLSYSEKGVDYKIRKMVWLVKCLINFCLYHSLEIKEGWYKLVTCFAYIMTSVNGY